MNLKGANRAEKSTAVCIERTDGDERTDGWVYRGTAWPAATASGGRWTGALSGRDLGERVLGMASVSPPLRLGGRSLAVEGGAI